MGVNLARVTNGGTELKKLKLLSNILTLVLFHSNLSWKLYFNIYNLILRQLISENISVGGLEIGNARVRNVV